MADREIRIRGTKQGLQRLRACAAIDDYTRKYIDDGRSAGPRGGVVTSWSGDGAKALVYHTKTAIVCVYQAGEDVR